MIVVVDSVANVITDECFALGYKKGWNQFGCCQVNDNTPVVPATNPPSVVGTNLNCFNEAFDGTRTTFNIANPADIYLEDPVPNDPFGTQNTMIEKGYQTCFGTNY